MKNQGGRKMLLENGFLLHISKNDRRESEIFPRLIECSVNFGEKKKFGRELSLSSKIKFCNIRIQIFLISCILNVPKLSNYFFL